MHVVLNSRPRVPWLGLALAGVTLAVLVGFVAGNPTPAILTPLAAIAAVSGFAYALVRPQRAYLFLAASSIMLLAIWVPPDRGLNLFDLLLPAILVATIFGTARDQALAEDARQTSDGHAAIRAATDRLIRACLVYFGIAVLSIVPMLAAGRTQGALNASIALARAAQGLLLFPLGLWLVRSDRQVHHVFRAMLVAGGVLVLVNTYAVLATPGERGGNTWYVNTPSFRLDWPNEAATGLILLILVLLIRHQVRPRLAHFAMIGLAMVFIVATRSRTGLLELGTLAVLTMPRARWGWVALAIGAIALALPLVPSTYWDRLANTLFMRKGSFDAFSALMRVVAWKAAWSTFLAHPWFGVGYLGFSSFSSAYNPQGIVLGPAENYFLEIAAGLGLPGLIGLAVVIWRLIALGRVVHRHTPPGTLGHIMSSFHVPFIVAALIANLPGDILIGMMGLGQLALWSAMVVRTGHHAIESARA